MATAVTPVLLAAPVVSGAQDWASQVSLEEARSARKALDQSDRSERRSRVGVGVASALGATEGGAAAATASAAPKAAAPVIQARSSASALTADAGRECGDPGRTVTRPVTAAAALSSQWSAPSPGNDVTYDLSGVTSTAYPATKSPFAVGTVAAALRTCVLGGAIWGEAEDSQPWQVYHEQYNAACVTIVALEWMQVRGLRCDNVEDGIKPLEHGANANNAQVYVSGTYLSRIRDDCMENDYTLGGVLEDSLWESCNTGISERPSRGRSWSTPSSETLVLDRMLIGLYETPHIEGGRTVMGENALFKWSSSGNRVVIRCSVFKVDSVSLNGRDSMAMPPGTVVDDSACPDNPSTIVWLGGGDYPAWTAGMRVVADPTVWSDAVSAWKTAHGFE